MLTPERGPGRQQGTTFQSLPICTTGPAGDRAELRSLEIRKGLSLGEGSAGKGESGEAAGVGAKDRAAEKGTG